MKDHVEIGHLTKYVFKMNRDQVMDLEVCFKIHVYNVHVYAN